MPAGPPLRSGARLAVPALAFFACLALPAIAQDEECDLPPTDPSLDSSICLLDRFLVEVEWADFSGNPFTLPGNAVSGEGQGVVVEPSTPTAPRDTGYFWFFNENQPEVVVKLIDNGGAYWVFYGSPTNVEYTITVTDTQTERVRRYFNPAGTFRNGQDTEAFPEITPESGALPASAPAPATAPALDRRLAILPAGALPSCESPHVACVHDGRFAIEAISDPGTGAPAVQGTPVLTTETSALVSHSPGSGIDTAVKILDGRGVNDSFWVFASAFAANDVRVLVTDLETGKAVSYSAEPRKDLIIADRQPFAPDPPDGPWLETAELPGFRFKVRVTGGGAEIATRQEADCIPETLCISGAVPGRSELFLRIVGPKPNGFLQPNVVKFSTSQIEVWIDQLATGLINYYLLDGATPGSSDLSGFFDRFGFGPAP
jgi:hypothetical protein